MNERILKLNREISRDMIKSQGRKVRAIKSGKHKSTNPLVSRKEPYPVREDIQKILMEHLAPTAIMSQGGRRCESNFSTNIDSDLDQTHDSPRNRAKTGFVDTKKCLSEIEEVVDDIQSPSFPDTRAQRVSF
jgi:hypothetical protein